MERIRRHRALGGTSRSSRGLVGVRLDESVYPPREDSFLLLPFARVAPRTSLLEVGAGSGIASLEAARAGARVVATDRNPWALRRLRSLALGEELSLSVVRTDLARGLGRFDRVLSNPPYLPTQAAERDPDVWRNLALDGGPDGCCVTARLVAELDRHLRPEASAFVVTSSLQEPAGLAAIRRDWARRGGGREVVASRALEGERLEVWRLFLRRPVPLRPGQR